MFVVSNRFAAMEAIAAASRRAADVAFLYHNRKGIRSNVFFFKFSSEALTNEILQLLS